MRKRVVGKLALLLGAFVFVPVLTNAQGRTYNVAGKIQIQTAASAQDAQGGNTEPALISIQLSDAEGKQLTDARVPTPSERSQDLELAGSDWRFGTISSPSGFNGQLFKVNPPTVFAPQTVVKIPVKAELRLVKLATPPDKGLYMFSVLPKYGLRGGRKFVNPWRRGGYTYWVIYQRGSDWGRALGSLTIP